MGTFKEKKIEVQVNNGQCCCDRCIGFRGE